jgi:hypothetical protein
MIVVQYIITAAQPTHTKKVIHRVLDHRHCLVGAVVRPAVVLACVKSQRLRHWTVSQSPVQQPSQLANQIEAVYAY